MIRKPAKANAKKLAAKKVANGKAASTKAERSPRLPLKDTPERPTFARERRAMARGFRSGGGL